MRTEWCWLQILSGSRNCCWNFINLYREVTWGFIAHISGLRLISFGLAWRNMFNSLFRHMIYVKGINMWLLHPEDFRNYFRFHLKSRMCLWISSPDCPSMHTLFLWSILIPPKHLPMRLLRKSYGVFRYYLWYLWAIFDEIFKLLEIHLKRAWPTISNGRTNKSVQRLFGDFFALFTRQNISITWHIIHRPGQRYLRPCMVELLHFYLDFFPERLKCRLWEVNFLTEVSVCFSWSITWIMLELIWKAKLTIIGLTGSFL